MKRNYKYLLYLLIAFAAVNIIQLSSSCNNIHENLAGQDSLAANMDTLVRVDSLKMPGGKFGETVKYGKELLLHTAYYIGPDGVNGKYLGNKMNCTNCHQDAGTKPYSLNLVSAFNNYPAYRAREGKVLSLAERVNNCIMHPHIGKPLPLDGKEMIAITSYLKWISDSSNVAQHPKGLKNVEIDFPDAAASSANGAVLYAANCKKCHGDNGQGEMRPDNVTYKYPPLWGDKAYQPGSSMHRIVKLAQWLVSNMPYDKATHDSPVLSGADALDLAAFVNDDRIHKRPPVKEFQYPFFKEKAIDYHKGPFNDPFPESQHKFGPYKPIIAYYLSKGWTVTY